MPAFPPPVLHPVVVHFVVGLLPVAAVAGTLAAWRGAAWLARATTLLAGVAAFAALVAVVLGYRDLGAVEADLAGTTAGEVASVHQQLGLATTAAAFAAWAAALWRGGGLLLARKPARWVVVGLLWAAAGLVLVTALYGGSLVYEHGVSTPPPPAGA